LVVVILVISTNAVDCVKRHVGSLVVGEASQWLFSVGVSALGFSSSA